MRTFQCDSSVCLCPLVLVFSSQFVFAANLSLRGAGCYLEHHLSRVCTFVFASRFVLVFCLCLCFRFDGTFVFSERQWSLCWAGYPLSSASYCICLCEHIYFYRDTMNPVLGTGRVAKCHRYDGYICVKILASWGKSLGEHIIWLNLAFFGEDLRRCVRFPCIN